MPPCCWLLRMWPRYWWYSPDPNSPAYGLLDFSMGGPRDSVGLELVGVGEVTTLASGEAAVLAAAVSVSSFLMREVMSKPRKGFCSGVRPDTGEASLVVAGSGLLAGDREHASGTIRNISKNI